MLCHAMLCFNLAIERLFISGYAGSLQGCMGYKFQSRNRDAFHFRDWNANAPMRWQSCFNLAIEMLFISGGYPPRGQPVYRVSISQSRGFSFQAGRSSDVGNHAGGFNLAIERLFISGNHVRARARHRELVSISQSRGFSFQGNGRD